MKRGQKKQSEKVDRRQAILQAAWALIRHYGYAKTTIDDIAKDAGVGKGTVYMHFRSKAEIMLALTELTNDRIIEDLEKIAAKKDTPENRIRECVLHRVMTLFDIVHKYPHGQDVISSMLPDIVVRLERYVKRHGELLQEIIEQGSAAGDFATVPPEAVGPALANLFEHFTPPYYRFRSRKSLESFTNQILDLILKGLLAR
jgi:AcrR family transcriptional regulator